MREELFEEILSLVEEYINELDLGTMQSSNDKRKENWENSLDDYLKASKEGDEDKKEEENLKSLKARNKFYKNSELTKKRIAQKVADFKEKLINKKPQTPKQTQQADSDHANAIIDQHLRNKLEKAFSNECFESLISLIQESLEEITNKNLEKAKLGSPEWYKAMSQSLKAGSLKTRTRVQRAEEGKPSLDTRPKAERKQALSDYLRRNKVTENLVDLISLIEGELINFQEKRKQKVLDRNAEKMAKMMQDGSLNAVRVLPNKELIGDRATIKMVKDIQKENNEVINKARKKA